MGSPGEEPLEPVPVLVELRLPSGVQLVPVQAARVDAGRYVLTVDGAGLVLALAERVKAQSDILGKRAEKTLKMREGSGF